MAFRSTTDRPGEIQVSWEEKPIFRYQYLSDLTVPSLHPVWSPSGITLTGDASSGHPHHQGVFFWWPRIERINVDTDSSDEETPVRTVTAENPTLEQEGTRLALRTHLWWQNSAGETVLEEWREVTVLPPEDRGWQLLDWRSEFKAPQAVAIVGESEQLGLTYIASDALASGIRLNARHEEGPATDLAPAEWCCYSGPRRDDSPTAGIAILAARRNPQPRPEFVTRSEPYGLLSTGVPRRSPMKLLPGKSLVLRYRIALFDGPPDLIALQTRYVTFLWA